MISSQRAPDGSGPLLVGMLPRSSSPCLDLRGASELWFTKAITGARSAYEPIREGSCLRPSVRYTAFCRTRLESRFLPIHW